MGKHFGSYRLLKKIGSGGMAEVFVAEKVGTGGWKRKVALKRMLPPLADRDEYRRLFFSEAAILGAISHSNIVHIYDYKEIDSYLCIEEEYIEGSPLDELLYTLRQPLPYSCIALITYDLVQAVRYLHEHENAIVHGDISSQNAVITKNGVVKLVDFGVAKSMISEEITNLTFGKKFYAAPELFSGKKPSPSSDVYALGAVCMKIMGLPEASMDSSPHALVHSLPLSNLPKWFLEITKTLVAQSPEQRTVNLLNFSSLLCRDVVSTSGSIDNARLELSEIVGAARKKQSRFPLSAIIDTARLSKTRLFAQSSHANALIGWVTMIVLSVLLLWPASLTSARTSRLVAKESVAIRTPKIIAKEKGGLHIDSYPWSHVFLNGKHLGNTPIDATNLNAGSYRLDLVPPSGDSLRLKVVIEDGRKTSIFKKLR